MTVQVLRGALYTVQRLHMPSIFNAYISSYLTHEDVIYNGAVALLVRKHRQQYCFSKAVADASLPVSFCISLQFFSFCLSDML